VRKTSSLLLATGLVATALLVPSVPADAQAPARRIDYVAWDSTAALRGGTLNGAVVRNGSLRIGAAPAGTRTYAGHRYAIGAWISPWRAPGFGLTELIPSWDARTPGNSFVEISVRGRTSAGRLSSWDVVGRWASGDRHVRRTSVPGQGDDLADVNVDTWQVNSAAGVAAWQVRVTLLRGGSKQPTVDSVGAVASRLPDVSDVATSAPGPGSGTTLRVPRYSQMIHQGHYPAWGSGGEAWCSPTSTSMVLGYYHALPPRTAYGWVPAGHPNPWVDFAARSTYDHSYDGTGNWPFNTAYAATRTGHAFVTRLRNLREAGLFIAAGIPVVASIAFGSGELDGAPISASNGHLVVIVGFTAAGNVVVNDPAASRNQTVRRTYDRGQFEDAWIPKSGGTAYVITDADHPLPRGAHTNW
jgi:hypothetical protein